MHLTSPRQKKADFIDFLCLGLLLYAKAWTEAPFGAEAPRTDLQLCIDIGKFEKIDTA